MSKTTSLFALGLLLSIWLIGCSSVQPVAQMRATVPALAPAVINYDTPRATWCEPKGFSAALPPGATLSIPPVGALPIFLAPQASGDSTPRQAHTVLSAEIRGAEWLASASAPVSSQTIH
jgi:hypothetical protein